MTPVHDRPSRLRETDCNSGPVAPTVTQYDPSQATALGCKLGGPVAVHVTVGPEEVNTVVPTADSSEVTAT